MGKVNALAVGFRRVQRAKIALRHLLEDPRSTVGLMEEPLGRFLGIKARRPRPTNAYEHTED